MRRAALNVCAADRPEEEADRLAPASPAEQESASVQGALRRYHKVLIVEDAWLTASEFEDALAQAGFAPTAIAVSFDEAVASCQADRPDFVLMDIRLIGPKDGVEAAIEIYRRWAIRSVFVSAHDEGAYPHARAANPFGWISKPISGDSLVRRLRDLL